VTLDGHTSNVFCCAFSPDGRRVCTASGDRLAKIWDLATGALLLTLDERRDDPSSCSTRTRGGTSVFSCVFSPDGTRVATASDDVFARIFDAATGALGVRCAGHTSWVRSCAFAPTSRRLLTASNDTTAKVWDARTGQLVVTLVGHGDAIRDCAFARDGRRVATASFDRTARIWNAWTGHLERILDGHTSWVWSVAFSDDGRRLATASYDNTARLWDAVSGGVLGTLRHKAPVYDCVFVPVPAVSSAASM